MLLELKNFNCGYGRSAKDKHSFTIKDINLKIEKGLFAGIIGPNGAGKSTLFKGISGELKTISGQMILNGIDLNSLSIQERAKHIAIVSQDIDSIDISVEDYVLLGRYPYRSRFSFWENSNDYDIAHKYMKRVGVFKFKDKLFSELSGGQQQLVTIAKALTQEPELLLLDEPTSHLDISHQVQVLDLIQQLNQELGLSVLIIIHDLNMAGEYCEQLIMMNDAKLFISGSANDVLSFENIEKVYKTPVITVPNPISNKPSVFPISHKFRKN